MHLLNRIAIPVTNQNAVRAYRDVFQRTLDVCAGWKCMVGCTLRPPYSRVMSTRLVGKPEGKRHLGRPARRLTDELTN